MTLDLPPWLISVPFGMTDQLIQTPRYYWDNDNRGADPFVILQLTLSGRGVFELEKCGYPVPEDHAFIAFVPEKSVYYYPREEAEPWRCRWINFYGPLAVILLRQFRDLYGPVLPLPRHSAAHNQFHRLAQTAESRIPEDPHERSSAAYAFLMEWARQLSRPAARRSDPVQTAIALCRARFREPIGVKELADAVGLTREHFTRVFTQQTGTSPARHLRQLRVAAAREMMQNPETPLTEVALRCGFASPRSLQRGLANG